MAERNRKRRRRKRDRRGLGQKRKQVSLIVTVHPSRGISWFEALPDELIRHIFEHALEVKVTILRYGGYCSTCCSIAEVDLNSISLFLALRLVNHRFRDLLSCDLLQLYKFLCERSDFISFPAWLENVTTEPQTAGQLALRIWSDLCWPTSPDEERAWSVERYLFDGCSQDVCLLSDVIDESQHVQGHVTFYENKRMVRRFARDSKGSASVQVDFFGPLQSNRLLSDRLICDLLSKSRSLSELHTLRLSPYHPSTLENLLSSAIMMRFDRLQHLDLALNKDYASEADMLIKIPWQTTVRLRRLTLKLPFTFPPALTLIADDHVRALLVLNGIILPHLTSLSLDCRTTHGHEESEEIEFHLPDLQSIVLTQRTIARWKSVLTGAIRHCTVISHYPRLEWYDESPYYPDFDWSALSSSTHLRTLTLQIKEGWVFRIYGGENERVRKLLIRNALHALSVETCNAPLEQLIILNSQFVTLHDFEEYLLRLRANDRLLSALGLYKCALIKDSDLRELKDSFPEVNIIGICPDEEVSDEVDDDNESVAPSIDLQADQHRPHPQALNLATLFPGFVVDHLPEFLP